MTVASGHHVWSNARLRRAGVAGLVCVLAAVFGAITVFACAPQASVTVSPTSAPPSAVARAVVVHFNGAGGPVLWQGTPSGNGALSFAFAVPAQPPGTYFLSVMETNSAGQQVMGPAIAFTITAPPLAPPAQPPAPAPAPPAPLPIPPQAMPPAPTSAPQAPPMASASSGTAPGSPRSAAAPTSDAAGAATRDAAAAMTPVPGGAQVTTPGSGSSRPGALASADGHKTRAALASAPAGDTRVTLALVGAGVVVIVAVMAPTLWRRSRGSVGPRRR